MCIRDSYYTEVADIYVDRHMYDQAMQNFNSALELMIEDKANHNISEIYKSMADASIKAKKYDQAVESVSYTHLTPIVITWKLLVL